MVGGSRQFYKNVPHPVDRSPLLELKTANTWRHVKSYDRLDVTVSRMYLVRAPRECSMVSEHLHVIQSDSEPSQSESHAHP